MNKDIKEIIYSEEEIRNVVKNLGAQISSDYKDKKLLMVSVLKGSVVFMTDLMREISIDCEIDFMAVSSYGAKKESSGTVRILKDLDRDISGYDLLLVEDILDSGRTLNYLMEILYARNPASIRICTLFDKPDARLVDLYPDYKGLDVPNEFIVGYGLDYAEKYRNLPYIGVLKDDKHN